MKNLQRLTIVVLLLSPIFINAQGIKEQLSDLPNVSIEKIKTPNSFESAFELKVKQPIDHSDHSKGYFYQRVYLSHNSIEQPMVINTAGYATRRNYILEITELLNANQVIVEHRYFGESIPDSMDYNYLNLKQATADLHHINHLLKQIYKGKWLSTGISKGGVTTIFYRYYYPEDVDVSMPYVAPLNKGREDERLYTFLETVGTKECRDNIDSFQRRLLQNREEILKRLKYYVKGARLKFTYFSLEEAFEYAVMEYPFAFWQWGLNCDEIPDKNSSLDEALDYFLSTRPLGLFGDRQIEYFGSHYYQAATEMGYYGYQTHKFKELLKILPTDKNPMATFVPNKMDVTFNNDLLNDVHKWIENEGNKFIYIYGGIDAWTACAVEQSDKVDSKWFILEGQDHGGARIENMTEEERRELIETLEEWLSVEIE